jgi:hypothetical protein
MQTKIIAGIVKKIVKDFVFDFGEFGSNKEYVLAVLNKIKGGPSSPLWGCDCLNIKSLSPEILDDEEVMSLFVSKYYPAYQYASERLQNKKDFILMALNLRSGHHVIIDNLIDEQHFKDKDIYITAAKTILKAIKNGATAGEYLSNLPDALCDPSFHIFQ